MKKKGKIDTNERYSASRFIGSRIIESAAYCNQMVLASLYINKTQKTSVNWLIRLLLSLLYWPKVILLSGGHNICSFYPCLNSILFEDVLSSLNPVLTWPWHSKTSPKSSQLLINAVIPNVCFADHWWSVNPYAYQCFVLRGVLEYS